MDAVMYKWLEPGIDVFWLRSSVEQPFVWTIFKGKLISAYDINKRFYYHCALQEIYADKEWIDKFVANNTYRLIDRDTGRPEHVYLYTDFEHDFLHDWKHYYAQQYMFDLTADICFDNLNDCINAMHQLYKANLETFDEIRQTYKKEMLDVEKYRM